MIHLLPAKGKAGGPLPSIFHLPAAPPPPKPASKPTRFGLYPPTTTTTKPKTAPKVTAQTSRGSPYIIRAPTPARDNRALVLALAARSQWMPGNLGMIRLSISPAAIDLVRLRQGTMPALANHDAANTIGRVVYASIETGQLKAAIEIGDTPEGRAGLEHIVEGSRNGWSPGLLPWRSKLLSPRDKDYDKDMLRFEVSEWEMIELSSVGQPALASARTISIRKAGKAGGRNMQQNMSLGNAGDAKVAHTDDEIGLGLAVARTVLEGDTGAEEQRERLRVFLQDYDKRILDGETRDDAAISARAAMFA